MSYLLLKSKINRNTRRTIGYNPLDTYIILRVLINCLCNIKSKWFSRLLDDWSVSRSWHFVVQNDISHHGQQISISVHLFILGLYYMLSGYGGKFDIGWYVSFTLLV